MSHYLIQYFPFDSDQVSNVVMEDCQDVTDAIRKFAEKYGHELVERVVGVTMTTIST